MVWTFHVWFTTLCSCPPPRMMIKPHTYLSGRKEKEGGGRRGREEGEEGEEEEEEAEKEGEWKEKESGRRTRRRKEGRRRGGGETFTCVRNIALRPSLRTRTLSRGCVHADRRARHATYRLRTSRGAALTISRTAWGPHTTLAPPAITYTVAACLVTPLSSRRVAAVRLRYLRAACTLPSPSPPAIVNLPDRFLYRTKNRAAYRATHDALCAADKAATCVSGFARGTAPRCALPTRRALPA